MLFFFKCILHSLLTSARLKGFLQGRADWAVTVQQSVGGEDSQVSRSKHSLWGGAVGRQGLSRLLTVHLEDKRGNLSASMYQQLRWS